MFLCGYKLGYTMTANESLPTFTQLYEQLPPLDIALPWSLRFVKAPNYLDLEQVVWGNPPGVYNSATGYGYITHFESDLGTQPILYFEGQASTAAAQKPAGSPYFAIHCRFFQVREGANE